MANLKFNEVEENDFDVIPDANKASTTTSENQSFVKETEEEGRKLFQNKKANKALIISGSIIAFLIIAAIVFINIPIG